MTSIWSPVNCYVSLHENRKQQPEQEQVADAASACSDTGPCCTGDHAEQPLFESSISKRSVHAHCTVTEWSNSKTYRHPLPSVALDAITKPEPTCGSEVAFKCSAISMCYSVPFCCLSLFNERFTADELLTDR